MMKLQQLQIFFEGIIYPPILRRPQDRNRIEFFDLAKGVCIILVVLFHTDNDIYSNIPNFNALRMPLYFVLSGFFFKAYEPKVFFLKKTNNVLIPFLFWLAVSDIWYIWLTHYTAYPTIVQFVKDPFCCLIDCNPALWFLICLFISNAIFYGVYSVFKGNNKICFVISVLTFVGYLLFRKGIQLPLWIDSSLIALPFFFFGYYCKNLSFLSPEYSIKKSLFLCIGLIVVSYMIYYTFGHPLIGIGGSSFHGSPIMAYLNSITLVMGILLLCKAIKWLPIVSYFGRYSIIVLCVHFPILWLLPGFKSLGYLTTVWECTIFIMLACWLTIPICKRWLPYFVAQKPLFKVN